MSSSVVGIGATLGKIGVSNVESSSNQQINSLTFSNPATSWFVAYFLKVNSEAIKMMSNSATLPILNQSQTKDIEITSPPLIEQQQIVNYLDEQTQLIDQTIQQEEQKIELLKEYRQSLISEVVTGKICVV